MTRPEEEEEECDKEEEEKEDAGCFCSIIRTPGSRVNFWGVAEDAPVPADAPHPLLATLAIVTGAAEGGAPLQLSAPTFESGVKKMMAHAKK